MTYITNFWKILPDTIQFILQKYIKIHNDLTHSYNTQFFINLLKYLSSFYPHDGCNFRKSFFSVCICDMKYLFTYCRVSKLS